MRGVKGYSAFLDLDEFDPVMMTPVEVMHTFDLGVIKYFLQLWTGTKHKKLVRDKPWILQKIDIELLKDRINSVRLPHYSTRRPKFQDRDKWKADGMYPLTLLLTLF
jgi:hypothetical protein